MNHELQGEKPPRFLSCASASRTENWVPTTRVTFGPFSPRVPFGPLTSREPAHSHAATIGLRTAAAASDCGRVGDSAAQFKFARIRTGNGPLRLCQRQTTAPLSLLQQIQAVTGDTVSRRPIPSSAAAAGSRSLLAALTRNSL